MASGSPGPVRRPGVAALLIAGFGWLLAVVSGLATADPPDPGRHHDHGRFSAAAEGFPPQPVGMSATRPLPVTAFSNAAGTDAAAVAQADPDVRSAIGADPVWIGVEFVDPKARDLSHHLVRWYAMEDDHTVTATVVGDDVTAIERTPASTWQPPLVSEEARRAETIARVHLTADGVDVDDLEGYVMETMDPSGAHPSTRMAYVTFHDHVDARPVQMVWVDLSAGAVTRTAIGEPGPGPGGPSHFSRPGVGPHPPRSGAVDWNDWTFDYDVSGRMDGVSLNDVAYRGLPLLARASMPAMTVFYDNDVCGPFLDRLGDELTPVDWADGAEVVLREFTQLGEEWLELGILDTIGNYVLYQAFYLGPDGRLDAHTFAKGVQCPADHLHHPFWRFDVDVAGADGDQILRRLPDGRHVVMATEFDADAADAADHGWVVRDTATGHRITFGFDDGMWTVPGQVVPRETYDDNRVYGRAYSEADAGPWQWRAVADVGGDEGLSIDGADVVLWYRGFLPHANEEGPDVWHSTGVRLQVELAPDHFVRPDTDG